MWREPIMRPIARGSTAPRGSGAVAASGRVHRALGSGAVLRVCPVGLRAGAMDPGAGGRRATAAPANRTRAIRRLIDGRQGCRSLPGAVGGGRPSAMARAARRARPR